MKEKEPKMLKDNKLVKKVVTLDVNTLEKNGVYLTHTKDLIQIRNINEEKKEIHLFNMTEQCNQYVQFNNHILVERVR